jgi:hypothetical protein
MLGLEKVSISKKLSISYIVIGILIAILALISISGTNRSADGFSSYREMARDSVLASRVQANMLMVRMNVKDYINNPSQKEIDEFNHYYDKTDGFIKIAQKEIKNPTRVAMVKKIANDIVEYKSLFLS